MRWALLAWITAVMHVTRRRHFFSSIDVLPLCVVEPASFTDTNFRLFNRIHIACLASSGTTLARLYAAPTNDPWHSL